MIKWVSQFFERRQRKAADRHAARIRGVWAAYDSLGGVWLTGRELRAFLEGWQQPMSLPAFYQFMATLEHDEIVEARNVSQWIDGERRQFRCYRLRQQARS